MRFIVWFNHLKDVVKAHNRLFGSNVVVVDWKHGARYEAFYRTAAANSALISRIAADFCLRLIKHFDIPLRRVHFIGFSLGAHVAGYFSTRIFEETGMKVGKITGKH